MLDYSSDNIHEMPDANFCMGRYGQADVTVDGVEYCMQLCPPGLENLGGNAARMFKFDLSASPGNKSVGT
jgi:hypothetical protein